MPGKKPAPISARLIDRICKNMVEREMSFTEACKEQRVNRGRVVAARIDHPEWDEKIERAIRIQMELLGEDFIRMADQADPDDLKKEQLKLEARKWVLSKLSKKFKDVPAAVQAKKDDVKIEPYEERLRKLKEKTNG